MFLLILDSNCELFLSSLELCSWN